MTPDPERVAALIAEIAQEEIGSRFGKLDDNLVRTKSGPNDLVTIADELAERALRKALLAMTPGAGFVGEEAASADPTIVAALAGKGRWWIVDPLDGTRNFVQGRAEFGSIIAYVVDGVTVLGWIYAIPDDGMAIAANGGGVSWRGARPEIAPAVAAPLTGLRSLGWLTPSWRDRLSHSLRQRFQSRPGHCSAYAYLNLMRGAVDFTLSSRIHPWDHVAGALMMAELGGDVRWLENAAPYAAGDSRDAPLLSVAPGRRWSDIAAGLLAD